MELSTYFNDFVSSIRPTDQQKEAIQAAYQEVSENLDNDEELSPLIISKFIQGSYRRATLVQSKEGEKPDVDLVIVTRLEKDNVTPNEAVTKFLPFLNSHYQNKYELQDRSIAIKFPVAKLD